MFLDTLRSNEYKCADIITLLIIGSILRVYKLSSRNLALGEGNAIRVATHDNFIEAVTRSLTPPLYHLFLRSQLYIFGENELLLRIESMLIGLGTIVVVYLFAREVFNRHVGLVSALLLTLSIPHINWSTKIRHYTLFMFFVAISYLYFHRALRNGATRSDKIGYVLGTTALLYTHNYGLFVIVTQFLSAVILSPEKLKDRLTQISSIAILYSPGIILLYHYQQSLESGFLMEDPAESIPIYLHNAMVDVTSIIGGNYYTFRYQRYYFAGFLLIIIIVGLAIKLKSIYRRRWWKIEYYISDMRLHLCMWGLIIFILPLILNMAMGFPYTDRYLFPALVPVFILVGTGIDDIKKTLDKNFIVKNAVSLCAVIIIVILLTPSMGAYYNDIPNQEYENVANIIESEGGENDLVLLNFDTNRPMMCWYTSCEKLEIKYVVAGWGHTGGFYDENDYIGSLQSESPPDNADQLLSNYSRIWFIVPPVDANKSLDRVKMFQESDCWNVTTRSSSNVHLIEMENVCDSS